MWVVRGIAIFALAIIAGCQTQPPIYYRPTPASVEQKPPVIDTDKVEKRLLTIDLPEPPPNGARAFFGLKIKDCRKGNRTGAYVAGYFKMYEKSPAEDAGMLIGDEIVEINDNRIGISAADLETYIQRVAVNVMYKFKVVRQGQIKRFEIRSLERFPGKPGLTWTPTSSCQSMGLLDL